MSDVLQYLDCGCAITKDGHRTICPTCIDGGSISWRPASSPALQKLAVLESFGRQIQAERNLRAEPGRDDCYTDNARSRAREHDLTEQLIQVSLVKWRTDEQQSSPSD
jgi:hypothetical protein